MLVNFKRAQDTVECVRSLLAARTPDVDITICDNASGDDSVPVLRGFLQSLAPEGVLDDAPDGCAAWVYEGVQGSAGCTNIVLCASRRNTGFAGGNNLAFRTATISRSYDYCWFLNNDTEVAADCLDVMLAKMKEDAAVGICGSTLIYAHDRRTVQTLGGCVYQPWSGMIREFAHGEPWPVQREHWPRDSELSYVSGASMLVSADFLKQVGLMAEDYFLYFEEVDWAMRARRKGFRLAYAPEAIVYHKEGAAIGTGKSVERSALAEYYGLRNKLRVTWRHFPYAFPSVWLLSWLQVARRLLRGQRERARLMSKVLVGSGRYQH
ncbi:MAG TPA: glycosyltransferase family 2 protein [Candidatus Aquabacterium excrementipullorum]|nr:glycosyltransferase family 2 protein [Candidatus Aquabacterium excrementipullorum]